MSETVWVVFNTIDDFNAWHDQKCLAHGIPRPGKNLSSNVENVNACWTTAWVEPRYIKGGIAVPMTPEEREADGLMGLPITEPLVLKDGTQKIDPVDFEWQKAVPDTYVVEGKTVTVDKTKAEPTMTKTETTTTKVST